MGCYGLDVLGSAIPRKISIGSAFVPCIVWDLVLGSILGIHAFSAFCICLFD